MSSPIRCEGLTKKFGKAAAIDDLSLEVAAGSIYALIGPNGAGKTTLIKMMVNILRPSAGSCFVLDKDTRKLSPEELAQIGYVSENQEMPEWMTVGYFMSYLKPFYATWDDGLASELLREFELPVERKLGRLSRGMKMKAALASSLAYRPKLIILDEPFTGLDALVREEFVRGLLDRAAETTILISSHDLGEVESFASHVGFLSEGRLQCSEETTELYGRFREIEVTLNRESTTRVEEWPKTWWMGEKSDSLVRFVDSEFDRERTPAAIARCFPSVANVMERPMSLRDIFVAMARERQAVRRPK